MILPRRRAHSFLLLPWFPFSLLPYPLPPSLPYSLPPSLLSFHSLTCLLRMYYGFPCCVFVVCLCVQTRVSRSIHIPVLFSLTLLLVVCLLCSVLVYLFLFLIQFCFAISSDAYFYSNDRERKGVDFCWVGCWGGSWGSWKRKTIMRIDCMIKSLFSIKRKKSWLMIIL